MQNFQPYNAYIVACKRTACGKNQGTLKDVNSISLLTQCVDYMMQEILPKEKWGMVDDLIAGCVCQVGEQSSNIGRNVVLASKTLPEHVPGTTVDRQCGSSQQALHFACQAVMSGTQDVVIAGGVEAMSRVPIGSNVIDGVKAGHGFPMCEEILQKYGEQLKQYGMTAFSQFDGAEILFEKYKITREECEDFAVKSHAKANQATEEGRFKKEIAPVYGFDKNKNKVQLTQDEGIRKGTTKEGLQKLKSLKEIQSKGQTKGFVTAGLASQIADGASCVMVCNEKGLQKLGLKPRVKVIGMAVAGSCPVTMLDGPIPATQKVLSNLNMTINQMDIYEVNEAFAPVPLAWAKALKADLNKLNVNGGAMALGHPLGGTGTKILTTMIHEMERRGLKYGLQAICEGGGTANATVIERCDGQFKSKL